ncbi:MAG: hypothetical protein JWO36_4379 [Myxococcales bacterium]|nr:hypothetical protein [Myxococcales bacterium]
MVAMKRHVLATLAALAAPRISIAGADEPAPSVEPAPPPEPAPPEPTPLEPAPPRKTPFDRGRVGLSLGGGSQSNGTSHYFVIGGGVGYFVLDGVELGLSALQQFGDGPNVTKVSPSIRYIAQPLVGKWPLIPYVGVFYNHWFITTDVPDVDSAGTRAGLLYISGSLILGLGVVYEHIVSTCTASPTTDCSSVYPDFTISLAL